MTKTFAQLTQEIEALKTKAEAVRRQEKSGVVARIKDAIVVYGLSAEDLGFASTARSPKFATTKKAAASKAGSAAKYRDGAGHSWTGMGPKPGWLKAALAAGQSLESLTIGNGSRRTGTANGDNPVSQASRTQPRKATKPVPVVKYQDDAGHTWSGRGPKPWWVRDAIAGGKTLEQLAA